MNDENVIVVLENRRTRELKSLTDSTWDWQHGTATGNKARLPKATLYAFTFIESHFSFIRTLKCVMILTMLGLISDPISWLTTRCAIKPSLTPHCVNCYVRYVILDKLSNYIFFVYHLITTILVNSICSVSNITQSCEMCRKQLYIQYIQSPQAILTEGWSLVQMLHLSYGIAFQNERKRVELTAAYLQSIWNGTVLIVT